MSDCVCVHEGYNRCSRLGQKAVQIMVGVVPGLEKQNKTKNSVRRYVQWFDFTSYEVRATYEHGIRRICESGPGRCARYRGVTQHCMPGTRTDYWWTTWPVTSQRPHQFRRTSATFSTTQGNKCLDSFFSRRFWAYFLRASPPLWTNRTLDYFKSQDLNDTIRSETLF